jgi:hypothetical protein
MSLNSYADVQAFIDGVMQANGDSADGAPHGSFWRTLSYNDFVSGPVPNVQDPNSGGPIPILAVGNSGASNIILALTGQGPLFDPNTGAFGQMPAGGTPFTAAQVQQIADWIDRKCPQ